MSLDDLPDDWPSRPLTASALVADVLDLLVSPVARRRAALYLLLCDDTDRLLVPIAIDELESEQTPRQRADLVATVIDLSARTAPVGALLAAVVRPGGLSSSDDDQSWAEAVATAAGGRTRLLGVHLVTPDGSRPLPRPVSGAA